MLIKSRLLDATCANFIFYLFVSVLLISLPVPSSASLLDGLEAYYAFDSNANDLSGNGNNGTVSGATLTTDRFGNPNSAYHFNGIDSFIDIGNGVQPPFPLTVGLWLNAGDLRKGSVFRNDALNDAANRWGLALHTTSTGHVNSATYEGFSVSSNRLTYTSTDSVYLPNEWHHYAVVFNANNDREIYWDGVLIGGTFSGTGSSMLYSGGDGQLGVDYNNLTPINAFLGDLDNITVHSRTLSALEIQDLMNFSAVPIPSAVWLFGSGLIGLVGVTRRKKL